MNKTKARRVWTEEEIEKLIEIYPDTLNKKVAEQLFKTEKQVISKAAHLNLKKSSGFWEKINSRPNAGHFQKSHVPWCKGKKGLQLGDGRTRFQKNHIPHNTKQDGMISLRFEKIDRPVLYYRVSSSQWIRYAHKVFGDYYGEVPPGMVIRHKNGNNLDCRIENLECLTKRDNRLRNSASVNLSDGFIVNSLIGKGMEYQEREQLKKALQEYPKLIETKRNLLKLKRQCQTR